MSDKRPTSELAAAVRAGFVRAFDPDAKLRLPDPVALAALAALEARITDLEAHATRVTDEWQAAEAQVAALTQERREGVAWRGAVERAEAAEAALATTRQALAELGEANWTGTPEVEEMSSWVRDIARRVLAATEEPA